MKEIYKIRTGSHLYGVNTPDSDEDFNGVFLPSKEQLLGFKPLTEEDRSSNKEATKNKDGDVDNKVYSLPKFLELLLNNNPNVVEYLFIPEEHILEDSFTMRTLRLNYSKIISQKVGHSFVGYAVSRKKFLNSKITRLEELTKGVTWLENSGYDLNDKALELTEKDAKYLTSIARGYKKNRGVIRPFKKSSRVAVAYTKLLSELNNVGWRSQAESAKKLGYCTKEAYHLIRMLYEGKILLQTGRLEFPLKGKVYDDIMTIRSGKVSYDDLITMIAEYEASCLEARENSTLREQPDFEWCETLLINSLDDYLAEERRKINSNHLKAFVEYTTDCDGEIEDIGLHLSEDNIDSYEGGFVIIDSSAQYKDCLSQEEDTILVGDRIWINGMEGFHEVISVDNLNLPVDTIN